MLAGGGRRSIGLLAANEQRRVWWTDEVRAHRRPRHCGVQIDVISAWVAAPRQLYSPAGTIVITAD
jgi:hypothetical protein